MGLKRRCRRGDTSAGACMTHLMIVQLVRHLQLRHLRPERHRHWVDRGEALRSVHADHGRGGDGRRRRHHSGSSDWRRRYGLNCGKVAGSEMPRVLHLLLE